MRPKQFINLVGEGSLFQQTLRRLEKITGLDDPFIVCNDEHRFMVAEQMQELGRQHHTIILEPAGRNTAPAIASAAMKLSTIDDAPETIMMVLPADHLIENVGAFAKAVSIAASSAKDGNLVTFGISPHKSSNRVRIHQGFWH